MYYIRAPVSPSPREEWKDENNCDSVYFPICNPYIPLLKSCNPTPHRPNHQNKDDFNLRELNPRRVKQHATLDFSDLAQSPSGDRSTRSLEGNAQAPWQKITANLRPSISWQEDETLQEGATSINAKRKRKQQIAIAGSAAKRKCNQVKIPRLVHMSIQQSNSDQAPMSPVQLTRTGRKGGGAPGGVGLCEWPSLRLFSSAALTLHSPKAKPRSLTRFSRQPGEASQEGMPHTRFLV